MNKKRSYTFLMEYMLVILAFSICAAICVTVFTSAYRKNTIANKSKDAIEIASSYIENGDYSSREFSKEDIDFIVNEINDGYKHLSISANYDGQELINLEFYGGDYD